MKRGIVGNRVFAATAWLALGLAPVGVSLAEAQQAEAQLAEAQQAEAQRALVDQYCVACHNDRTRSGNLSLREADLASVADHGELWEKVVRKLRGGLMPPPGHPRPVKAVYDELTSWLEAELDQAALADPMSG